MSNFNKHETIISAGIDIGTSTTKLIISRFSLRNVAGATHVPRIEITDKEILYKSPVFRTPLQDAVTIDVAGVQEIIRREYEKAEIQPSQIETGAVIITGETATKRNASEMLHLLSDEAGDFLVATAGPDLEGIIAAKGSGSYESSGKSGQVIANIDIGGGTANIAVFQDKQLLGTCTMHIGGRLIEFEHGKVRTISPPVERLLQDQGYTLQVGDPQNASAVTFVTTYMAEAMARILKNEVHAQDQVLLLGHEPNWLQPVDTIVFSGGISECMYHHTTEEVQEAKYDDMGIQLAEALLQNTSLQHFTWQEPVETVRATVLGAGTQTTEISGATIQVAPHELPLKNIPIYQYDFEENLETGLSQFEDAVQQAVTLYDSAKEGQNFALYLSNLPYLGFRDVQKLASAIVQIMNERPRPEQPIILVIQSDHAKVIGQTLAALHVKQSIICIDQINVETGDYIDIGNALTSGVVPVVVKTLTFHTT
ncbi:ethanolamine utilization protein [Sporosarcina sp. P21c]|uniref:ethanolamine ammonia-lyase reactivating factor EutA n=1 Tax=unclassified Sporosarcina TaxID=2647733 RepID=UPI000C16DF81|nr:MULTISPECIES: ethanolamine ammonia-lyase reactivating factor EutA [unclassified Sporosarcina]PIC68237.1 ethanolamine utilization protein [Sporosarcina sp. P16a]PIC90447.1 ethanolamine utilization protein [Sporosarcina sp. P21c]PIC93978.1 ethanolamine utilization protein [Sporosarcina sp. P25]